MSDIFDSEEPGAGPELAQSTEPAIDPAPSVDAFEGTQSSPDAAEVQEPTDQGQATAPDQGDQDPQGEEAQQLTVEVPDVSEDEVSKLEQEAEAALSDARTPKWYKNAVEGVYKPKLATLKEYSALGTVDEVRENLDLLGKLDRVTTDPYTRMPIHDTADFVKELYEKKGPELAYQLMTQFGQLPANDGTNRSVLQALVYKIGIDPARIPEIQQFAANGYTMQAAQFAPPDPDDLQEIPDHLKPTFSKLAPEIRDSLMADVDYVRNQNLEAHKYRLDAEERQQAETAQRTQNEQQQAQTQQQQFIEKVDNRAGEMFEEAGDGVLTMFRESLSKQLGMSELDALMVSNTVLNAMEPTLSGRQTKAALKTVGIEIDAAIQPSVDKLMELTQHAAYYEAIDDKKSVELVAADIAEIKERIVAKSNKMVAALAKVKNGNGLIRATKQIDALNNTKNDRHAFSGVPAGGERQTGRRPEMDFSDESYISDLRAEGFR